MFPEGLFPSIDGLRLEALHLDPQSITAMVAVATPNASCPLCGVPAMRVQSRYVRTATDLLMAPGYVSVFRSPSAGFSATMPPALGASLRRERLGEALAAFARRTKRLTKALCAMAFAAGGEGGARLAHAQAMPVSPRTLLRLLEFSPPAAPSPPRVVGIAEWAWKKGRSYGTILVDLERKQPVDLLSDRNAESVKAWFKTHPGVEIIVRDRSGLFADGAKRGAPDAMQVIDRYHLVKNLVEALEGFFLHKRAVLNAVHKKQQAQLKPPDARMRPMPVMEADPPSQQAEAASLRRQRQAIELSEKIQEYAAKNVDVTAIAQHVGASRRTVYRYRQMTEPPPRKQIPSTRKKLVEAYQPYLVKRWNEGVRNSQQLWRELRERGGKVSAKTVSRFVGQLRKDSGTARSFKQVAAATVYAWTGEQQRSLTSRQSARLLVSREETLQEWQKEARRLLADTDQEIATATRHVHSFLQMLRQLQGNQLDGWLDEVETNGIAELRSFAQGLRKEYRAVKAGLTEPWSNGPTEAHVQRLKLLKRQMDGQAGFPLLRQRVLHREEKLKTQLRKKKKEQPVAA